MTDGYFKYYKSKLLISLLVFLGILIYLAKEHWGISVSIIAIISTLLFIIDKWLWKTKIFSKMFWIDDFSGTYEGQLEFEFKDSHCKTQKGILTHKKVIHQTGSRIKIYSFSINEDGTQSSVSENIDISVKKLDGKQFQFIYSYLNNGNSSLTPHFGTEIIKFIVKGDEKYLSGRYFTERLPYQTKGKFIDLRWVSNSQTHEF